MAFEGAAEEIGVGLLGGDFFDGAFDSDLAFEGGPPKVEAPVGVAFDFLSFSAEVVGVEKEAFIDAAEEDHSAGGAVFDASGETHSGGFGDFVFDGGLEPEFELLERVFEKVFSVEGSETVI